MIGNAKQIPSSHILEVFTFRLGHGQDLTQSLADFLDNNRIEAAFIMTCVGSLNQVTLRFANQDSETLFHGFFEIVSLVGTLSIHGLHLHLSFADPEGITIGGHLLDGTHVYTTAEIVVGVLPEIVYKREMDNRTGYKELGVTRKSKK